MRVEPYLFFNGQCEEAIGFYQAAIGATTAMLMRFSDEPTQMPVPPDWGHKVMHAGLMVGDTLVMMSDGTESAPQRFAGVTLSITADTEADAHRFFNALAAGGSISMPLLPTFWSPCFGMLTDRFGVSWMVGVDGAPA